ncbi:hypothetical protein [Jiulongibacter sp. NS-SX5]
MEKLPWIILNIEGAVFFILFLILLYLIIKRINNRNKEDFEKRDN